MITDKSSRSMSVRSSSPFLNHKLVEYLPNLKKKKVAKKIIKELLGNYLPYI